jgi:threonine/homoserine/homoserine lactone efflux protein
MIQLHRIRSLQLAIAWLAVLCGVIVYVAKSPSRHEWLILLSLIVPNATCFLIPWILLRRKDRASNADQRSNRRAEWIAIGLGLLLSGLLVHFVFEAGIADWLIKRGGFSMLAD